jgi:hypothetical protein
MNLVITPEIKNGRITNEKSNYVPTQGESARLAQIRRDLTASENVRNKPYPEFNDRSLVTLIDDSEKAFNGYVAPRSSDPQESWKSDVVRPLTRSKVISIAAHVTAAILFPTVHAQNEDAEEDRAVAEIMKDLMEFSWEQSKYERLFVSAVTWMLVNPIVIVSEEFNDVKRKIKEIKEDGTWDVKTVTDELYSGFQNTIVPVDEMYITNIYEPDWQKQRCLIRRRIVEHTALEEKYADNPRFKKYISAGVRIFCGEDNQFYRNYDTELNGYLDEEITYYNRFDDLEVRIVNGVLMDDPDRPMQRKDKAYPFVFGGGEMITDRFAYRKSVTAKLWKEQELVDVMYRMVIDGSFLKIFPSMIAYGDEAVSSVVMVPGALSSAPKDTKIEPVNIGADLSAGMNMLTKIESSISESSQDPSQLGMAQPGQQTAYEIARLEQNAQTILGLFGKSIKFFVEDFGDLRINTIIQHALVPQMDGVISDGAKLKYKSFLIPNRTIRGKKQSRKIVLSNEMPKSEEEMISSSFDIMAEEDKKGGKMTISVANPKALRSMKYLVKVEAETMKSNSEAVNKALNLEAYDRLIKSELTDHDAVTRRFLVDTYAPGDETLMAKQPPVQPGMEGLNPQVQQAMKQKFGGDVGKTSIVDKLSGGLNNSQQSAQVSVDAMAR